MSMPSVSCPNCGYDATNLQTRLLCIAPSPFEHLFDIHTSREEISAARAQLKIFTDAVRGELHDLEARVARLRKTLQEAEQHHAEAKGVLDVHVMLNPPIESLPNEILAYIFSWTFEKSLDVFDPRPRVPWLLGQVCRSWRMLAWQTPTLWNSFGGRDHSQDYYGLEEVLKRSGNSALYVSLDGLTCSCACILAQHASRLSTLELKCSFETLSAFKASPEMSILTKLCLTVNFVDYALPKQVYFDIATKAPRLTHVELNLELVSIDIPRVFLLPWPQITHLKLELGATIITTSSASYPNVGTLCPSQAVTESSINRFFKHLLPLSTSSSTLHSLTYAAPLRFCHVCSVPRSRRLRFGVRFGEVSS